MVEQIKLKYGHASVDLQYEAGQFEVLSIPAETLPLTDAEINAAYDAPTAAPEIEDIAHGDETVLLVVPDATRQSGSAQTVTLLVQRLIAGGTAPGNIRIIFATGIHRKVTQQEKNELLTPFIAQRIRLLDHDAFDAAKVISFGKVDGIAVELSRALLDTDKVILVGGVTFHYFAGFTGGRKLICPGLASAETIRATHALAFDCVTHSRREGVGTAMLAGNAVHRAFVEAASLAEPAFGVNAIVDGAGYVTGVFCGDWYLSHEAACKAYERSRTVEISEKRPLVIASCGGYPYDVNLIQAHKALDAASHACVDGGQIILLAECADGLGRSDFLKWFEQPHADRIADRLCREYEVNGQTAWSLLKKAERFNVRLMSGLDDANVRKMRMSPIKSLAHFGSERGFIIPSGASVRVRVT